MKLDLFVDVRSPWVHLAVPAVRALAEGVGAQIVVRPVSARGLEDQAGIYVPGASPDSAMALWRRVDLARWADRLGRALVRDTDLPWAGDRAMAALAAIPEDQRLDALERLCASAWIRGDDVDDDGVLGRLGLTRRAEDVLATSTREARVRGVFDVPALIVDGELFVGLDRLPLVEERVRGACGAMRSRPDPASDRTVTVFHDFASPYSYLGVAAIRAITPRVALVPILLGGLFRDLGTPDVPNAAMSESRRAYLRADMAAWAAHRGLPFRFPSRFPLRTIGALRAAIVAPAATAPLYAAAWAEDRDVADPVVVARILDDAGLDGAAIVHASGAPAVKQALRDNTDRARDAGVFGVPAFVVDGRLFWGQDRVDQVAAALAGWEPPG